MSKKLVKYSLFLLALGLIAGFVLALVNSFTSPKIKARQESEAREKLEESFEYAYYKEVTDQMELDSILVRVYYAFDESKKLAAVIYQTEEKGYQSRVVSLVGIKPDGVIIDAYMIEENETPGKGDRVYDHKFKISDEDVNNYDYELLAGVTRTSEAVGFGIDAATAHFITIQNQLGDVKYE